MLPEVLGWWGGNSLAHSLRQSLPLFVAVQTLHLVSVTSLAGVLVLRAGMASALVPAIPRPLLSGLIMAAIASGLLLTMPEARDYAANPFLPWKLAGVALLVVAVRTGALPGRLIAAGMGLAALVLGRSMGIFL